MKIEDYEHEWLREQAFIREEMHRKMIAEWQEWEDHQNRLPAKIQVIIPKEQEHEANSESIPF